MQQISASALVAICSPIATDAKAMTSGSDDRVITAELDSLVGSQAGVVRLQGNVIINDGQRVLLAEEALLNQGDRRVGFPQGLVLGQNDLVVQGQQASMGLDGESLDLQGVQWLMPKQNLRGTASGFRRSVAGAVVLTDAQLTRCSPGNDGWSLEVRELQINEAESFAQAKGAVLGLNRFHWLICRVCESLWTASNRLAGRCPQVVSAAGMVFSYRFPIAGRYRRRWTRSLCRACQSAGCGRRRANSIRQPIAACRGGPVLSRLG